MAIAAGSYRLVGRLGSGSAVCEAILRLAGVPLELVDLGRWPEGAPPAELLAVNPLGQVPALIFPDGSAMSESAAICICLADRLPALGLSPDIDSPQRPAFLHWMLHLSAGVYGTELRIYYPHRYTTDPAGLEAVREAALKRLDLEWTIFADALGDRPFLLGDRVCAADLYAAMLVSWADDLDAFFDAYPRLAAHYRRVVSDAVVAAVWQRHGMPVA